MIQICYMVIFFNYKGAFFHSNVLGGSRVGGVEAMRAADGRHAKRAKGTPLKVYY